MAGRSSAKGDIGLSIDRVRCTRKTGRWLASLPDQLLSLVWTAEPARMSA